jgi:hypothetical protein
LGQRLLSTRAGISQSAAARLAWQPILPSPPLTEQERLRERIIELGIDSMPRWMLD